MLQGIQDAYISISLVDGKGNVMGRAQDTPTTNNLAGNYVLFNCQVWPPESSLLYACCQLLLRVSWQLICSHRLCMLCNCKDIVLATLISLACFNPIGTQAHLLQSLSGTYPAEHRPDSS